MTRPDTDREMLEDLFAAARAAPPRPGADLVQRVLAEALIAQDAQDARNARAGRPRRGRGGIWRQFREGLGGWGALGGLAASALTGVWIGIAAPSLLSRATAGYLGTASAGDYLLDVDVDLALGLYEED